MADRRVSKKGKAATPQTFGKRWVAPIAIIVILAAVSVYLLTGPLAPSSQPVLQPDLGPAPITFDPPSIDFGNIAAGSKHTTTVQVTNTGAGPLRVLAVRPSCVCLSIDFALTTLQPGASVPMSLTIDALSTPGIGHYTASMLLAGFEPAVLPVQRNTVAEVAGP